MATYDTNLVFCTEAQVFAVGGYTWTTTSEPTDTEVYTFAQFAAGEITLATDRAGARYSPPASGVSDVALRNVLQSANATGAAYRAWRVTAIGGDPDAIKMRNQLREDWIRFIGGTSASGEEVVGAIVGAVQAASSVLAVRTDQTDGYTQFPATTSTTTLARPFAMTDVD